MPNPPTDRCVECGLHAQEYDSPGKWCRFCWVEWWIEDYPPQAKPAAKKRALDRLQKKFGDPPE